MSENTINFLNNIDFENTDNVYHIIETLYEENQKYKEVIDKAIEYINLIVLGETLNGEPVLFKEEAEGQYLLSILKGVE